MRVETTYRQLRSAGLVDCAEAFSSKYLGKNKNWYAYQKYTGRDYSIHAAIQCIRSLRSQQRVPAINTEQRKVLTRLEQQLISHVHQHHCIAEVC